MKTTLITLLSAVTSVMGHGYVQEFLIGGERYTGSLPFFDQYQHPAPDRITQAFWANGNSFVDDVTSTDIACDKGAVPAKLVAKATAGSEVTFFWTAWPDSHKGPVITYLADCGGDCTTAVGSQLNWFKIDEAGLMPDGTWAADALIKNNNTWTVTLPSKIKNGQYLMRHEIIALHAAENAKGAQFYPSCTNIEISGATGENTPETVKFPGAYSATDPGILINIYYPKVTNYTVPGPKLYSDNGPTGATPTTVSVFGTSTAFPVMVPTATQGVFPSFGSPYGTGGVQAVPTVTDTTVAPEPYPTAAATDLEDEEDETVTLTHTTTIVTTIGGQHVTMTAVYTTTAPSCDGEEEETETTTVSSSHVVYQTVTVPKPAKHPKPTAEPEACTEKVVTSVQTVTVTQPAVTVTVTNVPVAVPTEKPSTSVMAINTEGPHPYPTAVPTNIPTSLPTGFSTIPAPTAESVPTTTSSVSQPTGTGVPMTPYGSALTRRDCDEAYMKCQRSYEGCMKRAKRSGMQTRSCEKYKRDVCVEGLRGCDARIWGYGSASA
ncbi:hypothetical protein TWF694_006114 [Orbilia ellipsospora]|uniref:lytic cellulose monooxygenase (C4-dehydrogenating) n=1 Tax=Orbilia ellipsospora TaxID=2528407 RepID=A0AAV9WRA0_9PEZI